MEESVEHGRELLVQRQPAKALEVFDALLRRDPQDVEARVGRAAALIGMGEPQLALADCEDVLATQPAHSDAVVLKCWANAGR